MWPPHPMQSEGCLVLGREVRWLCFLHPREEMLALSLRGGGHERPPVPPMLQVAHVSPQKSTTLHLTLCAMDSVLPPPGAW